MVWRDVRKVVSHQNTVLQSAVWVEGIGVVQKWPEGEQHLHKPTGTSFTPQVHSLATDTNAVT